MTPPTESFDAQALLSHVRWMRALARELVPADRHLAEDLAQDACLAALRHRPRADRPLSGWLATVVRNLARQTRRGAARRDAREAGAAQTEALPSTLDVLEKVAAHREVVAAVMTLEEPYRTTILLRFYEGLSPSAIARAQAVPVATVKTRLSRGLDRLRAKLDVDHGGDGRSWLLALIPLTRSSGGPIATTVGTLLVSTNLKIAITAAVLVCGAAILWPSIRASGAAPPAPAAGSTVSEKAGKAVSSAPLSVPAAPTERMAAAQPEPSAPTKSAVEPAALLRGRVLDLQARPLSGVRVSFQEGRRLASSRELGLASAEPSPDAPSTVSEPGGRFEIAAPQIAGRILAVDPRLSTVLAGLCGPGATKSEVVLVVAPRLAYAGRVVAEDGQPLRDARVALILPEHFRKGFPEVLDYSEERGWFSRTDAQGLFEMSEAPQVEGARLQATLEGWLGRLESAPETSSRGIEIVMRRPRAAPGSVSGQVTDETGTLVAGARVSLGLSGATSDEQGAFTVVIPEGGVKAPWIAVKRGYLPAIETASSAVHAGRADGSEFIVLKLGGPPLSMDGRVVDASGEPVGGMKVWAADPTFFGRIDEVPAHVEGLLAGGATRADIERRIASLGEGASPEEVISDMPTVMWAFARTGADGRFHLEGLLDREYRLAAMDPETLLRVETDPIRAGSKDVEIALRTNLVWERVAGRVVSASSAPVPGVSVVPMCDVITAQESEGSRSTFHAQGKAVATDAQGHFEIKKVPRERVYLRLDGESILPLEYGRKAPDGIEGLSGGKVEDLVLRVELRYHLQVELGPEQADFADSVRVLDGRGGELPLNVFMGNSRRTTDSVELKDGRSDVMVVTEDAQTLVLFRGETEVKRVAIHLAAGPVNVVRP